MRILLASVTNAPSEILREHLRSVRELELPPKVSLDLAYASDGLSPEALVLLDEAGATIADVLPRPDGAIHRVSEATHEWSEPTFAFLAREKQRLLDYAKEERYDAIFFVDSDLVLGPETLSSLVGTGKDVVSAVFWTSWQPGAPPLPQVWMRHPYEFDGRGIDAGRFLRDLEEERALRPVGGLGACTLIKREVFEKVRWFPLVEGLPQGGMWQGEDRHFCVHASRNHVLLYADAWPDIFHIYRPSDLSNVPRWRESLPTRPETPSVGDWISASIEAIEEKELLTRREEVRGRLGTLRVLPEIEMAFAEMRRGDVRVVKVAFPSWWSIPTYRATAKSLLLRLHDVKRYPS
jgi:hypothetical protein